LYNKKFFTVKIGAETQGMLLNKRTSWMNYD